MQSDGKSSEYEGEQEKETKDAVVEEHGEGEDQVEGSETYYFGFHFKLISTTRLFSSVCDFQLCARSI